MVNRKAFTMIEIIFVIVVLGILAGIAIPKMSATRDDAFIAKAKATIASVKSGIATTRGANMLAGNFKYPDDLNASATASTLFGAVLQDGVIPSSTNGWTHVVNSNAQLENFRFNINSVTVATFEYNNSSGGFNCVSGTGTYCVDLTK